MLGIRRRLQRVVTIGHVVDHNVLTRQARAVYVGPTRRYALIIIAIMKAPGRTRIRTDSFDIDCAKSLLVADGRQSALRVEEQELVEVAQVIVAVPGRPDEQIRPRRRTADHEVRAAGVIGEKVEAHDPVRAGCDAAVLYVVIVCAEGLGADREIADPCDEIDAHVQHSCGNAPRKTASGSLEEVIDN